MSVPILEEPEIRRLATPITLNQYTLLYRAGQLPRRAELIEGAIIEKMPQDSDHAAYITHIAELLKNLLPEHSHIRQEKPFLIPPSQPEPDLAVVPGRPLDYATEHPTNAHLVIEVSGSSAKLDRTKAQLYARAGVQTYWIVLLKEGEVEVRSRPSPDGYETVDRFALQDEISLPWGGGNIRLI
ncbi:MAG: Uma2 family endonuclease [Spirochaetales bacterium]|nr:Uma2 family endonuclease [Spirochaetales bacterium]